MKQTTLYMIGHGHIDPTWLWKWEEGFEEVRSTFRSALDRIQEDSEIVFTASSACFYEWVKVTDPELFAGIQRQVAAGRWEIVGGFWVEPDCNVPSGESFVRHGLYSQRFFQREFGKLCRVGFNPDSFGHAATLPQILSKLGMQYYAYMRPEPPFEMDYPGGIVFWWQAPDGSRVLASQIPLGYDAWPYRVLDKLHRLPTHPYLAPGQHHIPAFYGIGNHGGGPTRETIDLVKQFRASLQDPAVQVEFSSLEHFFENLAADQDSASISIICNELQHHARGCYAAHSQIKRLNREVEHALMTAERFATIAWLLGSWEYPHDAFEKCWKDLLYNQFHDILAGTSLESSYEDSRDQLGAARHRAHVILNAAVQTIARDMDTSAPGNTLIAFNPLPWPVTTPVTAPPAVERTLEKPLHIVDASEEVVASQPIRGERIDHTQYRFIAQLPAMGYRVFHVRSGGESPKHTLPLAAGTDFLQNHWWSLEFDPVTGELTRLFDNVHKVDVLNRGHILGAMVDNSDTWSHGVEEYRVEAGRFGHAALRVVEQGDVQVTLRVLATYDRSTAVTEYTLYRDTDHITCDLRINWQQQYQALKLAFETRIAGGTATFDAPYGCQVRVADGGEEPGQQWFDLTGEINGIPYGLAVLNDSKYSFDVRDGVMRITLLRSPAYAHHDNGRFDASALWPIMDQGWQRVKLELMPHAGDWRDARVVKRAWELNAPAFIHPESAHPGGHVLQAGLLGTEADNVLLSVIKCSEDGDDIIIRGYETAGRSVETRLHLPYFGKSFDLSFAPHEIKTFRLDRTTWTLREVNLLEA